MNKKQKKPHDESKPRRGTIDVYAVQCTKCQKWRTVAAKEDYEELRSKFMEEPYFCSRKQNVSCDDPADLELDSTRTWVIDKPNVPKTPEGFTRELILRPDYSKLDAYYITPEGKKVRCVAEVTQYLDKHPELKHLKLEDFNFAVPKIVDYTIPEDARKRRLEKSVSKNESASADGRKKIAKKKN